MSALLDVRGISISFGGLKAVQNFSLSLEAVNLLSESFRQYARTETNLVYVQELKPRFYLGGRFRF